MLAAQPLFRQEGARLERDGSAAQGAQLSFGSAQRYRSACHHVERDTPAPHSRSPPATPTELPTQRRGAAARWLPPLETVSSGCGLKTPAWRGGVDGERQSGPSSAARNFRSRSSPRVSAVIDLERRVLEAETLVQQRLELAADRVAVARPAARARAPRATAKPEPSSQTWRSWTLSTLRVARERLADLGDAHSGRSRLEQYPAGVAEQSVGGPEHQRGDEERGDGIRADETRSPG